MVLTQRITNCKGKAMFDFEEAGSRRRVEAILTSRMNERCLEELRGTSRAAGRATYITVTCLIPRNASGEWAFSEALPALSRDISKAGISVIHDSKLNGEILVEVPRTEGSDFVRCAVQHNHEMGHGHFHVGLSAKEVVHVEALERNTLERRLAEFEAAHTELSQ